MLNQETENHSVSDKKYLVPFILITSLFFLWGFARAILDVLNKHFQNALHISITQSALIQVTTYLGYFLMAIPAGIFINKYGYRRGVVFGLLLFGLGAIFFIPGASIGITLLLIIPINLVVHHLTGIESLNAILPVAGGAALVVISMALTFIAGLIPSGIAARKDPVEALRTE